jgi:hypothetical protein
LGTNDGRARRPTAATTQTVLDCLGREREERGRKERRERRKKVRTPVQVRAGRANRTGATESCRLLWGDWWIRGVKRFCSDRPRATDHGNRATVGASEARRALPNLGHWRGIEPTLY